MVEVTEQYIEEMQAKITAYREENYLQHKKLVELEQGEWYWKRRCHAAEDVIESYSEWDKAFDFAKHGKWQELKDNNTKHGV
jgi:hypothetical protein